MHITWQGDNYFRLQNSNQSLVFNPYGQKTKASIILFSDPKQIKTAKLNEDAFVIDSPGEYEHDNIFVYGRQINGHIIFLVTFEDVKIAFLGEYGHAELTNSDLELVEDADVVILPIGGGDLTTPKEAVKLIRQIEPRVVIPSCYKSDSLNNFIKEFGVKPENVDKLKIQKKDLPQDDIKLYVLGVQS